MTLQGMLGPSPWSPHFLPHPDLSQTGQAGWAWWQQSPSFPSTSRVSHLPGHYKSNSHISVKRELYVPLCYGEKSAPRIYLHEIFQHSPQWFPCHHTRRRNANKNGRVFHLRNFTHAPLQKKEQTKMQKHFEEPCLTRCFPWIERALQEYNLYAIMPNFLSLC